ncbi:hypothetical protein OE519_00530 [Pseudomonas aeruginosa]|jgi:hypothetical protein|uniref:Defence against restriction A N-terminal domain-containing protein n=1 Tax=Comamonas nitrativorans TaxID=108437 RepID=A0ABV9GS02_9BURK|nr:MULTISPECIES: hypothetical protein [Pseudomonadota]MDN8030281.1 hypothetical protein [Burkholderia multivorans]MCU8942254.1 hypothetical protein [Pseudomonas aeruginosa]MDH1072061.1 hypothetical protein [Pseudomonas nitroreducens]OVZ64159.1 hypothetical protein CDO44_01930 [Pigmentiphaga sp. NML080357]RPZ73516.1 hypothetical protein IPC549_03045 [Pseudomonas aeruginosa]
MKNLLFSFEDLSAKDKAAKQAARYFSRAGANVVQQDVPTAVKRSSGITYREMALTFADSQQVVLRIKQSGDIFQVLLNGKVLPIKNQDDHVKAIAEIVQAMDAGRSRFQKLLAAAQARPPAGIRTAAPKMEQVLTEKRDALKAAIAEVRSQIEAIKGTAAPAAA